MFFIWRGNTIESPNDIRLPSSYVHFPECYSGTILLCPFFRMLFGYLPPMSITPNGIRIPSFYVHYPECYSDTLKVKQGEITCKLLIGTCLQVVSSCFTISPCYILRDCLNIKLTPLRICLVGSYCSLRNINILCARIP